MKFDLVGIGNPVYDIIVTPFVKTDGRVLSGCSTNACLAAKRLGMQKVGLIGCVGRDYAERFRNDMMNYGVEVAPDALSQETGGFRLVYDTQGDRTLDVLGVAGNITPRVFPDEFLSSKFILIGPILGEVDLELVEFLRSSSSAVLFLDPQGMVRKVGEDGRIIHECNKETFEKIAGLVDFIKPNEHESETITREKDPIIAVQRLAEMAHAGIPVVTLAERGSIILDGKKLYRIPAFRTKAIDPTGAGDVYGGAFLSEYAHTGDIAEAALFASAAASVMVEQVGPDFTVPVHVVEERKKTIRTSLVIQSVD